MVRGTGEYLPAVALEREQFPVRRVRVSAYLATNQSHGARTRGNNLSGEATYRTKRRSGQLGGIFN